MTEGEIHAWTVDAAKQAMRDRGFAVDYGRRLRNGRIPDLTCVEPNGAHAHVEVRTRLRPSDVAAIMAKYELDGAAVYIATSDTDGALYVTGLPPLLNFPATFRLIEIASRVAGITLLRIERRMEEK